MTTSDTNLNERDDIDIYNAILNGDIDIYDPVLISLVRKAMPNLIAYDICGVQPMTGPSGLTFGLRARYGKGIGKHGDEFDDMDIHERLDDGSLWNFWDDLDYYLWETGYEKV